MLRPVLAKGWADSDFPCIRSSKTLLVISSSDVAAEIVAPVALPGAIGITGLFWGFSTGKVRMH